MLKNKLNARIPKWPKTKFEKELERLPKKVITWFFCYQYENNMDLFLHIIDVLALGFIAWRLMSG